MMSRKTGTRVTIRAIEMDRTMAMTGMTSDDD
jgi:hypothetical protein